MGDLSLMPLAEAKCVECKGRSFIVVRTGVNEADDEPCPSCFEDNSKHGFVAGGWMFPWARTKCSKDEGLKHYRYECQGRAGFDPPYAHISDYSWCPGWYATKLEDVEMWDMVLSFRTMNPYDVQRDDIKQALLGSLWNGSTLHEVKANILEVVMSHAIGGGLI